MVWCNRFVNFWSCSLLSLFWFGAIQLIWSLHLDANTRLVLIVITTLICILPLSLTRRRPLQPQQGNIINMPQADVDSFIQPLITDNTEVMRRMEIQNVPSLEQLILPSPDKAKFALPSCSYSIWTCQYARKPVQKSRTLCFLLRFEQGVIVGFGDGRHGPCEINGEYIGYDKSTVLISFVLRFRDHERQFHGVSFGDDFSRGIRGLWSGSFSLSFFILILLPMYSLIVCDTVSRRFDRLGWFRLWPESVGVSLPLYRTVSVGEGCLLCCRDLTQAPLVAIVSCGHVLACRECLDGVCECPACRTSISRLTSLSNVFDPTYEPSDCVSIFIPSTEHELDLDGCV